MIGYIIITVTTALFLGFITIGFMEIDRVGILIGGTIITFSLFTGSLYLDTTLTLKEFTVYQNGNIELKGKNYFGDDVTHKFSFTGYKVVKGSSNTYSNFESKIKLTDEYYEQYKDFLKTEESITIKIEK